MLRAIQILCSMFCGSEKLVLRQKVDISMGFIVYITIVGELGAKLDTLEAGELVHSHSGMCLPLSLVMNMLGMGGSKSSEAGVSFELSSLLSVTQYPIRLCSQPMQRSPVLYSRCEILYLQKEW